MRYIFLLFFLVLLFAQGRLAAQTNLVCNHSFEDVNETILNKLKDAQVLYSSHLSVEEADKSLFNCWYTSTFSAPWQSGWDVTGVTWGIVPGFFLRYNGDTDVALPDYPNEPFVVPSEDSTDAPRAFTDESHVPGLTLSQNNLGQYGFDLSPPTTKFGENVDAADGSNYVALFDFENDAWQAHPALITELKYPLVEGIQYAFSAAWCKMNLIGYIKNTEGWSEVNEGKIKVWVCNSVLNQTQQIIEIDVNSNDWHVSASSFIAHNNSTHLLIEYNPVLSAVFTGFTPKIGGAFIDNVKLYEACETPENMCNNANYHRDLLDVRLEEVELYSPLAFPDDVGNDDGYFETIRAYHLENVKRFEIKIYPHGSNTSCYELDMWYPQSDWFWDGKDFNGNPVPEGQYDAVINAVSNDCFHITNADEKQFDIKRKYSVFNIWSSTNAADGNTFVNGLDNVHHLNVELYTLSGQLVHSFDLTNPPNSIGLSLPSIIAYGNAGNGQVASGYYNIKLTAENNCTEEFSTTLNYINLSGINDSTTPSPFYDWSPVPKPEFFPCPFDMSYHQNYLAPMNCCEGNLYLNNVEIWNDWNVQIWDTIFAGPNVVFQPGVTNYLLAGEQVVLLPDETGVIVADGTIIDAGTLNCPHCKIADAPNTDPDGENPRDIVYADMQDSLALKENLEPILYPNPAANGQELTVKAGKQPFDENSYKLVLSNTVGVEVPLKILSASPRLIRFKPVTVVSAGAYYLYLESCGVQQTFNVVVR